MSFCLQAVTNEEKTDLIPNQALPRFRKTFSKLEPTAISNRDLALTKGPLYTELRRHKTGAHGEFRNPIYWLEANRSAFELRTLMIKIRPAHPIVGEPSHHEPKRDRVVHTFRIVKERVLL